MANTVLVGSQFGDEGKGKIIDLLAEQADYIVRYQGGNNAGHTIEIGDQRFILHLVPSGILHDGKICIIGNGVVVDPAALTNEINELRNRGVTVEENLMVSDCVHLIFPYHRILDELRETRGKTRKLGTTKRGIGPAYADKSSRIGIRMADLLNPEVFAEKLQANLQEKNEILQKLYGVEPLSFKELHQQYLAYGQEIKKHVRNVSEALHYAVKEQKNILFESAQGTLLDVDFGTYPYVTSSNPVAGGACVGTGVSPKNIDHVFGVAKAYTTRVGEGPFPTEFSDELHKKIQEGGREYGATTGRPRRCGWFDAVITRYAVRVNGIDSLAITKLDVLSEIDEIMICVAYRYHGQIIDDFPTDVNILRECNPVYKKLEGWHSELSGLKKYDELPHNARRYVEEIASLLDTKVKIISVGAKREETIFLS